ncbi:MAG: RsmB/NOP family class I SAM-dependent RNA methyltransferase [Pseudomonadota bacterium]|nr:RsmB/NOP family class I SAM-dependent RNA methyltransferase [Pseudomonadota bacterium]
MARTAMPADRFVRDYFRARRYAGSKDRAAVAERLFQVFRHRASYAWRMGDESPRALVIAALLAENLPTDEIAALFAGGGYGPVPLTAAEQQAITHPPAAAPPLWVQGEFPAFLEAELTARFDGNLFAEMQALNERAPVDLRVNTLKAARAEVLAALRTEGYAAEPTPYAPLGIRLPAGSYGLDRTALFAAGAFEFQGEAAQIAAILCEATAGMRVLDLAAGAGGKALALAAAMENRGVIVASDISLARLAQISPRAARSGATIITTASEPKGAFDRVLLDAPCSGSGTWRRQPEQKWRLTPVRLAELMALQDQLLDQAATQVAPGGRLIYATCSLLPCENEGRIAAFLARRADFAAMSAEAVWRRVTGAVSPPGMGGVFRASPYTSGMDGFFTAVLARAE